MLGQKRKQSYLRQMERIRHKADVSISKSKPGTEAMAYAIGYQNGIEMAMRVYRDVEEEES